jgi:putative membrane protein
MRRALLFAGVCAIAAWPALAQTPSTPTAPAPSAPPTAAPAATSSAPSTADFVKTATISGMFEIQSSELALRKKVSADREFARRMIKDHGRAGAQLKALVHHDHVNVQLPTKLDAEHQKMLDQLRGESGSQFQKDYAQMQQQGHQEAVALFQGYSQSGDNSALKQWAAKTLPTLQEHLSMAGKLS